MKITRQAIDSLHKRITDRLEDCLGYRPELVAIPHDRQWTNARLNERINFELVVPSTYADSAERERGQTCRVFSIRQQRHGEECTAWADYREEWYCVARREFCLFTLSWTFYWGAFGQSRKRQLFRANWDGEGAEGAPQPHWHFDATILEEVLQPTYIIPINITNGEPNKSSVNDDLFELPPISMSERSIYQELTLGDIHLGMGWHESQPHPDCWRKPLDRGTDNIIVKWNEATLKHAQKEFERLYVPAY